MVMHRQCAFKTTMGEPCRMAPLTDSQFCWAHSPEHYQEAQDARRLGGLRRKREATISGAYDIESLNTIDGIRRLIEIAATDTLGMENSIARNRTLTDIAMVALRILELRDYERRMAALEQSVNPHNAQLALPIFDVEPELLKSGDKEGEHDSK